MKKVLATVAALGLVVGVTANALALDKPGRVSESEATTAPRVAAPTAPGVALRGSPRESSLSSPQPIPAFEGS